MYWEIEMYNGTQFKQAYGNNINDAKPSEIRKLSLSENPTQHSLPFDSTSGTIKFTNLDQEKIKFDLINHTIPEIKLSYNYQYGTYELDEKSKQFLQSNLITEKPLYLCFGAEDYDLNICGDSLNLKFTNEQGENLLTPKYVINKKPYHRMKAYTDAVFGVKAMKTYSGMEEAKLGIEFELLINNKKLILDVFLIFDYTTRYFKLNTNVTSEFDGSNYSLSYSHPDRIDSHPLVFSQRYGGELSTFLIPYNG